MIFWRWGGVLLLLPLPLTAAGAKKPQGWMGDGLGCAARPTPADPVAGSWGGCGSKTGQREDGSGRGRRH